MSKALRIPVTQSHLDLGWATRDHIFWCPLARAIHECYPLSPVLVTPTLVVIATDAYAIANETGRNITLLEAKPEPFTLELTPL